MKSVVINNVVYSVGDDIFRICNGFDISRLNLKTKSKVNKCVIDKITDAGYVYIRDIIPCHTPYGEYHHTERIDKKGFGKDCYIIPYDSS